MSDMHKQLPDWLGYTILIVFGVLLTVAGVAYINSR